MAALLMGLSLSWASAVGAANPPGWTRINACVNNSTFAVQIRFTRYSSAQLCPPGYTQLWWQITEPDGPNGPRRPPWR